MCGIIGFSGVGNYSPDKIKLLTWINSVERGKDATGFYTPKTGVIKKSIEAKLFMSDSQYYGKIKRDTLLLGHVRAKTVGANFDKNAHPFEYGNIVGLHNGTLQNHFNILRERGYSLADYDVDSQILIKAISEDLETPEGKKRKIKVLSEYLGAAAVLFTDKRTGILYAYRNKERPLFYGYLRGEGMYISSIKETLTIIGCSSIDEFDDCYLYKIKDGKIQSKVYNNQAIKSRPSIHNVYDLDPKEFVDRWLKVNNTYTKAKSVTNPSLFEVELKLGEWFLVTSVEYPADGPGTNNYKAILTVTNSDGEWFKVGKFAFDLASGFLKENEYAYITNNLVTTTLPKREIAKEGDIVKVTNIYNTPDGESIKVINEITNEVFSVPTELIRKADPLEVQVFKSELDVIEEEAAKEATNTLSLIRQAEKELGWDKDPVDNNTSEEKESVGDIINTFDKEEESNYVPNQFRGKLEEGDYEEIVDEEESTIDLEDQPEYIKYTHYLTVMAVISNMLDIIVDRMSHNKNILAQLTDLSNFVDNVHDAKFLASQMEESEKEELKEEITCNC